MDINTIYLFITNSELGAAASIIGVIITVCGFIWTLIYAKAAKDAAREAVNEIQQSKTIVDVSTAIQVLEEVRRLHREKAWSILPDRYTALKKALVTVQSENPDLSKEHKAVLTKILRQISIIEDQIEQLIESSKKQVDIPLFNRVLSIALDKLNEMLTQLPKTR
ncbi:MAG: hypothetical protein P9L94_10855 [Candidatus Hinthialibacter antarcticus]|nr:hypothetical protein [Candidatus Hinthialibacter antarcticus]